MVHLTKLQLYIIYCISFNPNFFWKNLFSIFIIHIYIYQGHLLVQYHGLIIFCLIKFMLVLSDSNAMYWTTKQLTYSIYRIAKINIEHATK